MRKPMFVVAVVSLAAGGILYGCSSDEPATTPGTDAGGGTDAPAGDTSSNVDSSSPVDSGADTGNQAVVTMFTIPAAGGAIDVPLPSGTKINFAFPASAGGTTVTFTPTTAASIGWGTQFTDVVKMEPAGTKFATPVIVKPSTNAAIMIDFGSATAKGPGEGLEYSDSAKGFKLFHFSTLAIVPAGMSCSTGSGNGWGTPVANAQACTAFAPATSQISFDCKANDFCLAINASCCVDPASGSTECKLGDKNLNSRYIPINSQPYCAGIFTDAGATCQGGARVCTGNEDAGTCQCLRDCSQGVFRMDCNGTTCTCSLENDAGTSTSFAQSTTCGSQQNMHLAASNTCLYP